MAPEGRRDIARIVIRGGTVLDGTGGEPYPADVEVRDGRISAIGQVPQGPGATVDAGGKLVTPGFLDVHTHYDGQVTWSERVMPSSAHGVTTAVLGNCGVGFAPCRPGDRRRLVQLMEGVEDIPEIVFTEGLPWTWESFPDYLDFLASRHYDMDVGAYVPHAAVRVYAMGERGAAVGRQCARSPCHALAGGRSRPRGCPRIFHVALGQPPQQRRLQHADVPGRR